MGGSLVGWCFEYLVLRGGGWESPELLQLDITLFGSHQITLQKLVWGGPGIRTLLILTRGSCKIEM